MKRRDLIKTVSIFMGSSLSPSLLASLGGDGHNHHAKIKEARGSEQYRYQVLSTEEVGIVAGIADEIIPRTDTPGASDVGVQEFIDLMLSDWYDIDDREVFIRGLSTFTLDIKKKHHKGFIDIPQALRTLEIKALDERVIGAKSNGSDLSRFYRMTKELTLVGYYTSAEGMEKELKYGGPLGEYDFSPSGPPGSLTRY